MKCHNCGNDNKEGYLFCSKCGTKLQEHFQSSEDFNAEMLEMSAAVNRFGSDAVASVNISENFENDETVILSESKNDISDFENDETVILSESEDDISDFENDETVILSESKNDVSDFENDETVIMNNEDSAGKQEHIADTGKTPPVASKFDYRTVYKDDCTSDDSETAYIDHLRRLKKLLDDGIITEDEFTRKKQQILGL